MARTNKAAKKPAPKNDVEWVDFVWEGSPTPLYANFVALSDFDDIFSFAFAEVRPETEPYFDEGDQKTHVDGHVVASIRMPPKAMPEAMAEIVRAWNGYVRANPGKGLKRYVVSKKSPNGDG
ncbi:MAG: hypothetical protein Q8S73_07585 [Deltaproteobacteria bacterium]|nr:hypothetical protein [Myxococcales bacterium]MDP3213949.1 hypothetical protein [Deltaproteobacteria bacterium]